MGLEHRRGLGIAGVDARRADADTARGKEIEQPLEVGPRPDDHLAATLLCARQDRRVRAHDVGVPAVRGEEHDALEPLREALAVVLEQCDEGLDPKRERARRKCM